MESLLLHENQQLKEKLLKVNEELKRERDENVARNKDYEENLLTLISDVNDMNKYENTVALQNAQLKALNLENVKLSEEVKQSTSDLEDYKSINKKLSNELHDLKKELVQRNLECSKEEERIASDFRCKEDEMIALKKDLARTLNKVTHLEQLVSGRDAIISDFVSVAKRVSDFKESPYKMEDDEGGCLQNGEYCEVPVKNEHINVKEEVKEDEGQGAKESFLCNLPIKRER